MKRVKVFSIQSELAKGEYSRHVEASNSRKRILVREGVLQHLYQKRHQEDIPCYST